MKRRRKSAERSIKDLGIRMTLAALALASAYGSLTFSLAAATKRAPDLAHKLAPYEGRATARLSQTFMTMNATAHDLGRVDRLARLALRQDGTAVQALTALGFVKQVRGDTAGARKLFLHAQALSRRDLPTQLWAIEDAVARDDVPGALRHYDIALRTSRAAPDTLFPILANALADPVVRAAVSKTLASNPAWGPSFVDFAAKNAPDPRSTVPLLRSLKGTRLSISEETQSALTQRLLTSGFFEDAWNLYASFRSRADRRLSRDPQFTANLTHPTPFDWVLASDTALTATIQRGEQGGVFDFSAPPSLGGNLIEQVQLLPSGEYALSGHGRGFTHTPDAAPYWVLTCKGGQELGRVALPSSGERRVSFNGVFRVPRTCPVQTLTLVARPTSSMTGLTGQIETVALRPVRGGR
jgi:hypothetical protein